VKRLIVVASVVVLAAGAAAIVAVAHHWGSGDKTAATVGGRKITETDLDLTVGHFHEEADAAGRPFPAKGTKQYKQVQQIALNLLVDRAAIEAAAAKLGVHVTEAQVDASIGAPSGENEGESIRGKAEAAFRRATARNQLIMQTVSRKLTAAIRVRPAEVRAYYSSHRALYGTTPYARVSSTIRNELLSARKNAVLARWLAGVRAAEPKPTLD
jgi:hypothetical protein